VLPLKTHPPATNFRRISLPKLTVVRGEAEFDIRVTEASGCLFNDRKIKIEESWMLELENLEMIQ